MKGQRWPAEDVEYLVEEYAHQTGHELVDSYEGRYTLLGIRKMASKLGLKKSKETRSRVGTANVGCRWAKVAKKAKRRKRA